jgi:hypothetical protein
MILDAAEMHIDCLSNAQFFDRFMLERFAPGRESRQQAPSASRTRIAAGVRNIDAGRLFLRDLIMSVGQNFTIAAAEN